MTNLNMRRILKNPPTLRMMDGGSLQIPQGPGMDRAGFLARNPGVVQNQITSPSAPAAAPAAPAPTMFRSGNSFGDATSGVAGGVPISPGTYSSSTFNSAPAKATPPGVSPMPGAAPKAQGAPMDQGAAMDRKMLATSTAAPAVERPPMQFKDGSGGSYEDGRGGVVPGPPRGDKFKAVYEGGERVVSNKVQKDNPGLAPLLDSLRAETLARQGKTVAEADAKALGYDRGSQGGEDGQAQTLRGDAAGYENRNQAVVGARADGGNTGGPRGVELPRGSAGLTLRASGGFGQQEMFPRGTPSSAPLGAQTEIPMSRQAGAVDAAQDARMATNAKMASNARAAELAAETAGRGPGVRTGPAFSPTPAAPSVSPAPAATPKPTGIWNGIKSGASNVAGGVKSVATGSVLDADVGAAAGRTLRGAKSLMGGVGRVAAPLGMAITANDVANTSTEDYAKRMGAEAGQGLMSDVAIWGVGALADLGDAATFGLATKTGNWLAGNGFRGNEPTSDAQARTLTPNAATPSTQSQANLPAMDANMPGEDPNRITLRGRAGADVAGAAGVQKFVENGKTLYTNVAGDNKDMMDKRMVGIVPGMSKEAIDRTLNNPDGSRWSAGDNATLAANLRDGIDPYRGTSREAKASQSSQMSPLRARLEAMGGRKMSKTQAATLLSLREADQRHEAAMAGTAASVKNNETTNQTNLRGQDLDYEGKMAPIKQAARLREMNASIFKAAGGDNAKAAALAQAAGMPAKDFQDALAAQNASESATQATGTKARENAMKEFRVADRKDPSKWDEVASQQSYDAVRQIFPNIDSANEQDRGKAMPDAKAMANIFNRARTQDKVGWDAMKFWEAKRPVLNGMPNVSGTNASNVEQVGPFEGMVMLNGSNGDTILTQKDGRKLNLGKLDSREQKLLEDAQKKGWGN